MTPLLNPQSFQLSKIAELRQEHRLEESKEIVDVRENKKHKARETCEMKSFKTFNLEKIPLGKPTVAAVLSENRVLALTYIHSRQQQFRTFLAEPHVSTEIHDMCFPHIPFIQYNCSAALKYCVALKSPMAARSL